SYRDFPDSRAILASHSGKPEKYQKGRTDMKQFLIGKRIGAGILSAAMALSLSTAALAASGDAVQTYSADASASGKTFASTGTDENAILITDGTVTLDNITVTRKSLPPLPAAMILAFMASARRFWPPAERPRSPTARSQQTPLGARVCLLMATA
ncbi:MAG: hypothetical protein LUD54_03355, partial [Oscillospiraceae bacterium]|nr:hypothetical protein [Oscillospiraceae bacterium]